MVEKRVQPEKAGTIKMWSGLKANIPSGWALCDGQGGRPDLRNKFVMGVPDGEEAGGTGGSSSLSHSGVSVQAHAAQSHGQPTQAAVKIGTSTASAAPLAHTHPDHAALSHTVTQPSEHSDSRPPFYKICFIIKT